MVPNITEICRKKKEEPQPLGAGKRKRANGSRAKSVKADRETATAEPARPENPEEGWDDETEMTAAVLEFGTKKEEIKSESFITLFWEYFFIPNPPSF